MPTKEQYKSKGMHVQDYPNQIRISFTDGCNRNCGFCALPSEKKLLKQPDYVRIDRFRKKWLPHIPVESKNIIIAQDGEPLLNPDLHLIVCLLREQNPKRHIGIITNGDALRENPHLLSLLFTAGANNIQIDAYAYPQGIIDSLKGIKEKFKDMGIVFHRTTEGNRLFSNTSHKDKRVFFVEEHFKNKTRTRNLHSWGGSLPMTDKQLQRVPLNRTCSYPFKHLAISANGRVGACCVDLRRSLLLGNIESTHLKDIWNGIHLMAIRFLLKKGIRGSILPCSLCEQKTFRDGLYPYYQDKMTISEAEKLVEQVTKPNDIQYENIGSNCDVL